MKRTATIRMLLLFSALTLGVACSSEEAGFGDEGAGGGGAGDAGAGGGGNNPIGVGGSGGGPVVPVPADCANYEFEGQTYRCNELDACDFSPDSFTFRRACVECDPRYGNPPPGGCDDPGPGPGGAGGAGGAGPNPNPNPGGGNDPAATRESCMSCHNNSDQGYQGDGLINPHPFRGAEMIPCTGCHGGNPQGTGKDGSHVPPPPRLANWRNQNPNNPDFQADHLRRTLSGIDKLTPNPYEVQGRDDGPFDNLDYLQFINPGDLRVVSEGRGCGQADCHGDAHGQWVPRSILATANGLFSSTRFSVGVENRIPEHRGRDKDGDSLSDTAPRAVSNPGYNPNAREVGEVGRLVEAPEKAQFDGEMRNNGLYDANTLANYVTNANEDRERPGRVKYNTPLETLIDEQINITCGDCHLWSAGQNDRYADFRSSGCTACHMEYSYDGKSRSGDPNVPRNEPTDPDNWANNYGQRAHIRDHRIRNVVKTLDDGTFISGISDRACVGCHQGSNRTVLQFWGVRMDQNKDVTNNQQYPANPENFTNTQQDRRLYDPAVGNATFNGRDFEQHLLVEDYDGDNRDDTPPDVHYEAGMGCIDCHGSFDLHGGTEGNPDSGRIHSRQDQAVAIRCESCHGTTEETAATQPCDDYWGENKDCGLDYEGNPVRHVWKDGEGNYWLRSRVTGERHYIPQSRQVTIDEGAVNPLKNNQPIFNPRASYAMGRADGNPLTGVGPIQNDPNLYTLGFSHTDTMDCTSCHGSWQNTCIGCHLGTQYDVNNPNLFSNITGERILLAQAAADFVYQSPVPMYLGVNSRGKITQISPAEKTFWRYVDLNGNTSQVFAFNDRLGEGNNPDNGGRNTFPALSQNQMSAHAIRGKIAPDKEGPRYCVSCHLNQGQVDNAANWAAYEQFFADYQNNNFANFNFNLLQQQIGQNTGNQQNSPFWVHMAAGLGSGLFLFDVDGCPNNPLDNNANREYCNDQAPAQRFNVNNTVYDLDKLVQLNGVPNASTSHPRLDGRGQGARRQGASNDEMSGPLGAQTLQKLAHPAQGVILDSWMDADGVPQGNANQYIIVQ
jgi:hypothetical protein